MSRATQRFSRSSILTVDCDPFCKYKNGNAPCEAPEQFKLTNCYRRERKAKADTQDEREEV